jgi:hypothetical protein
MMRTTAIAFAQLITISVGAQTAVSIARQYSGSVVTILTEDANRQSLALGSGFIVGNGKVVTNYHVIEGARYATAVTASGGKFPIDGVFAHSGLHDLAVLSAPGLNASVTLSTIPTEVGERIYAIGSPEGLSNSISEGIVSGNRVLNGVQMIQITAAISPGSSGGPVINEKGNVIGVAVGAFTSGQSLNFAIPSDLISPLLNSGTAAQLSSLPSRKSATNSTSNTLSHEAVSIAELDWSPNAWGDGDVVIGHRLEGISLKNNTTFTVRRVRLIMILQSSKGVPLDYLTFVLCETNQHELEPKGNKECNTIPSGLSKYYDVGWLRNPGQIAEIPRVFDRRRGEKLIVRILDAEVMRE